MHFRHEVLEGIADGRITCAFRRWRTARVRVGTTMRTPAGLVRVTSVEVVPPDAIDDADARRAGFEDTPAVLRRLPDREGEPIFRIGLEYGGDDPRVALRQRTDLDVVEVRELEATLERFDRTSRHGPWTDRTLELIAERPATLAAELADTIGVETAWFKRQVRKLKELGLTESLRPGYRLSPRGEAFRRRRRA